ncbi:hypothetical protein Q3G72_021606 [Acer saccharum]|nr:hypothetical protein Q3G72_021606 [Acer saccharum]
MHDATKVAEQGLFTLTKWSGKGPWLEDGSELKPCWSKTNFDEIDESKGFITFSLTNGPEYHVSQLIAVLIRCNLYFLEITSHDR